MKNMGEETQVTGKVEEISNGTTKAGLGYKTYTISGVRYNQFQNINDSIRVGDDVVGMFSKTEKDDKVYRNLSVLGSIAQGTKKEEFKGAESIPQRKDDYPYDDYARGAIFGMLVNNTLDEMRDQGKCFADSSDGEARFNTIFDKVKKVVLDKRKKELGGD